MAPILMLRGRDVMDHRIRSPRRDRFHVQVLFALRHRKFVSLTLSYVLQLTAVGVISASAPYLVTDVFGRSEGDIGLAMLVMLSATILAVPVWARAGRKFGERRALVTAVAMFAATAAFLGIVARANLGWPLALFEFGLCGIPFAGMQVLPFTIIAHMIHAEGQRSVPAEGAFTGVWTASEKLGLALGPAVTGLALSVVHGDISHGLSSFIIFCPPALVLLSLPFVTGHVDSPARILMETPE
jgi:glycoside/pentoside/hexuronide:cation symporter, GPH family